MTIKNLRSLSDLRKVLLSGDLESNSEQILKIDKILKKYTHLFVITEEEIQELLNQFIISHKHFSSWVSYGQYGLGEKRIVMSNKLRQYEFYIETYNNLHDMSYLLIQHHNKISHIKFIDEYPDFEDVLWNYFEIKLRRDQQTLTELLTEKVLTTEKQNKTTLLRELVDRKSKENQILKSRDKVNEKIKNNSEEIADALIELCQIDTDIKLISK